MNKHIVDDVTPTPQVDFPVVGIGASAGGLEAVTAMFHKTEGGTGMAFVLVMHLDPDHESLMAELVGRKTHISVRQIEDNDSIEIDCLHVIPPGYSLRMEQNRFRLEKFSEPRGLRRPIDSFFASLAQTQGEQAACVVLSGTGADGTASLRIVKELGGVVAVQTPEEARYDGMPFSAITTKLVDFTLAAEDIIPRLNAFFDGGIVKNFPEEDIATQSAMAEIFKIIHSSEGNDFSGYKISTLLRRLHRRMQVLEFTTVVEYVDFLRNDAKEQESLAQDFLINVTSFFRDREHFEILRRSVILPLVEQAGMSDEIRIWVPGCSSGQEAYTIAMLVDETCEEVGRRPLIQIFATDIAENMISQARHAVYPVAHFPELPKKYQDRYTIGLDGKFEIVKKIREMVRFSVHNLLQDPPFSKIDLICCRNLIIYLGEELQTNLFPLLHFSLRPEGYLFLGTSENVTRRGELFSVVDQRARIFRRQNVSRRLPLNLPLAGRSQDVGVRTHSRKMSHEIDFPRHQSLGATNATIYEQYAPPFVRVTADGKIIDSSGDLSLFMMSRPGDDRSLHTLARDGVRDIVLPLLSDALKEDKRKAIKDVEIVSQFGNLTADIIAHPMRDDTAAIVFLHKQRLQPVVDEYATAPISPDRRIADLQEELQGTRLLLKTKVEEVETANEELKSSNEEMMSMNEELQSANEELTTANEELKNKIDELTLANADLDNFLQSSDLAMIVLDRGLRIRHITDAARKYVPIQRSDKGRTLTEFNVSFGNFDLAKEIRQVMANSEPFVSTTDLNEDGQSLFVRITPYFFADGSVEGVSITLIDVSNEVHLRSNLQAESRRLKLAMRAGRMGLAELDVESGKFTVDDMLAKHLNLKGAGAYSLEELTAHFAREDVSLVNDAISRAVKDGEEYEYDFRIIDPDGDIRWVRTRGLSYTDEKGRVKVVGPTLDITDENAIERREMLIQEMSHRIKNLFAVIVGLVETTPKEGAEAKKLAADLIERIIALGRVYDLARKIVYMKDLILQDLLQTVVTPNVGKQTVTYDGPDVFVGSQSINTLTLILHELATNAAKYGALSKPDGSIRLSWSAEKDGVTKLIWEESTPNFCPEYNKNGFGSLLIKACTKQLQGTFDRTTTDTGIHVELTAKLANIK